MFSNGDGDDEGGGSNGGECEGGEAVGNCLVELDDVVGVPMQGWRTGQSTRSKDPQGARDQFGVETRIETQNVENENESDNKPNDDGPSPLSLTRLAIGMLSRESYSDIYQQTNDLWKSVE